MTERGDCGTSQGRVAKRSRKLIDYDSARHHVETLTVSGMKNDRKMMKVSWATGTGGSVWFWVESCPRMCVCRRRTS